MNWVKPEFGDFLAPPKKKQKTEDTFLYRDEKSKQLPTQPNFDLISRYSPRTKDDLVVNKKKMEEVEYWLQNVGEANKYLLLTGPPGCGKLKTLFILCKHHGIDCIEWNAPASSTYDPDNPSLYQSEMNSFEGFILRASRYTNILVPSSARVVVVKDLPNAFLRDSTVFQTFLKRFSEIQNINIAFIISDNTIGHHLFPEHVKLKYKIKNINFNPITQKGIVLALDNLIKKFELSKINPQAENHSREVSLMCNGDLRNALAMFHFLLAKCEHFPNLQKPFKQRVMKGRQKTKVPALSVNLPNIVSDNKIDIFHGIGRVLYAKRENKKLVHDPLQVAEAFISSPNLFVGMVHENYMQTFSSVHDIAEASNSLATSDILLQDWCGSVMLHGCGVSVAAHGVMTSNSAPIKKFQQFKKSQMKHETILGETKNILESSNSLWRGSDILLDVAPYASKIPYLVFEHKPLLKRLTEFS